MSTNPFISICIPAYKNKAYVKRLLDSIAIQIYRDFEVVITDDSPDNSLADLVKQYEAEFPVRYYKNEPAAGSPANWNRAIAHAKGEWIKIMHDDDWFTDAKSLKEFYYATEEAHCQFIFSGFVNVDLEKQTKKTFVISALQEEMLRKNPLYLFRTNYIGHPSTTLIKNNLTEWFDEKIKWVVDFEFYIRRLKEEKSFLAIQKPLVNIGIGAEQITKSVFRNREVEIPENLYLLQKLGNSSLNYLFVYDYYWRLMRNLKIGSADELKTYVHEFHVPPVIESMIRFQQKAGQGLLKKFGVYSKICMTIHYLLNRMKKG